MKFEDITVKQALAGVGAALAVLGSGSYTGGSVVFAWVARVNTTDARLTETQLHLCEEGHLSEPFCQFVVPGYEEKPELYRVYSASAHNGASSAAAVERIRRELETPRPNSPDGR